MYGRAPDLENTGISLGDGCFCYYTAVVCPKAARDGGDACPEDLSFG